MEYVPEIACKNAQWVKAVVEALDILLEQADFLLLFIKRLRVTICVLSIFASIICL